MSDDKVYVVTLRPGAAKRLRSYAIAHFVAGAMGGLVVWAVLQWL